MNILRVFVATTLILSLASCGGRKQAKYIFFFIGDGYGLSQSILAEDYLDVKAGDTTTVHLAMNRMPVMGMATTYSANSLITCSSAAGTALATGVKTNNGMLGVTPDTVELSTIAERLHLNGFKIGIISSVSLDHATPAAFYANSPKRSSYADISKQLAKTDFEYFGGGSLRGMMKDSSVAATIEQAGYRILNTKESIDNFKPSDGKLLASSSITLRSAEIPYVIDEPKHDMHLSYFVQKVISLFEPAEKPLFVMVEGGKIDWSCHGNDVATTLHEVLEMDKAYGYAYDFYLRHKDETLIIVTADHETGGLGVGAGGYKIWTEVLSEQNVSEEVFSIMVDSLAKIGASKQQLYSAIEQNFGFNGKMGRLALNAKDSARIDLLYKVRFAEKNRKNSDLLEAYDMHDNETVSSLCMKMMSKKSGFGWTSEAHTGVAVPVRAIGVGAEDFSGFYDNTDIPKKLYKLAGFDQSLN